MQHRWFSSFKKMRNTAAPAYESSSHADRLWWVPLHCIDSDCKPVQHSGFHHSKWWETLLRQLMKHHMPTGDCVEYLFIALTAIVSWHSTDDFHHSKWWEALPRQLMNHHKLVTHWGEYLFIVLTAIVSWCSPVIFIIQNDEKHCHGSLWIITCW